MRSRLSRKRPRTPSRPTPRRSSTVPPTRTVGGTGAFGLRVRGDPYQLRSSVGGGDEDPLPSGGCGSNQRATRTSVEEWARIDAATTTATRWNSSSLRAEAGLEDEQPVHDRGEALGPEPRRREPLPAVQLAAQERDAERERAGRRTGRARRRRSPLRPISPRNESEISAPNTSRAASLSSSATSSPNSLERRRACAGLIVAMVMPAENAARNTLAWVSDRQWRARGARWRTR